MRISIKACYSLGVMVYLAKFMKISNRVIPLFIILFFPSYALAVCPVCSVAVAGGVGLSRWLGIDDSISGIWIGGLILSLVLWCLNYLKKKNINFPLRGPLLFSLFYFLTLLPLYLGKFIGSSCEKLWGVDKLFLGIVFGSLGFGFGVNLDYFLRKKNNGKVYFPFQKVVLPISLLIILSIVFYFLTR